MNQTYIPHEKKMTCLERWGLLKSTVDANSIKSITIDAKVDVFASIFANKFPAVYQMIYPAV